MLYEYGVNETEGTAMNINFRQIIFVLAGQLRAALMSKRVLTGYLIGVMAALKTAYLYGGCIFRLNCALVPNQRINVPE